MKRELLELIVCPQCGADLHVRDELERAGEVETGRLVCDEAGHHYPIRAFVPRFVEADDYADAFALEWNAFRTAHLDSFTGLDYLDRQLREFLDFPIERIEGKLVLDAGCGLGRFSEIILNYGGKVVAVDLSGAIDAAFQNLSSRDDIHFVQGDIFKLPFRPGTFDLVYSWGVLHHSPDPPAAFEKLPPLVRPGGKVMTMVYANYNKAYLATTELYRKLTTRLPKRMLLKLCYVAVPLYYVGKVPGLGPLVTRLLVPVSVRPPTHRWRVGNTFDLYSPKYAFTYDHVDVHRWYERAGLERIRPVGANSGVAYIATKPPVDDEEWGAGG
jgi:SAM-dependent methyltransferase